MGQFGEKQQVLFFKQNPSSKPIFWGFSSLFNHSTPVNKSYLRNKAKSFAQIRMNLAIKRKIVKKKLQIPLKRKFSETRNFKCRNNRMKIGWNSNLQSRIYNESATDRQKPRKRRTEQHAHWFPWIIIKDWEDFMDAVGSRDDWPEEEVVFSFVGFSWRCS